MDIVDRLLSTREPLAREAADEIERLREELYVLANSTFHSVDDYKERAAEALEGKDKWRV